MLLLPGFTEQCKFRSAAYLVRVVLAHISHRTNIPQRQSQLFVAVVVEAVENCQRLVGMTVNPVGYLNGCRAGKRLCLCDSLDIIGDGNIAGPPVRPQRDKPVDIVKSARRLCRTGTAFASLDVPLKIQRTPVKTRSHGIDHRSLLPGGEQIPAGNSWKPLLDYIDETLVTEIRVITKTSPYHPVIPVLNDFDLPGRLGLGAHKLPTPYILVGTQVETPGNIIGNVFYELAHEVRGAPAKMIHIVVT